MSEAQNTRIDEEKKNKEMFGKIALILIRALNIKLKLGETLDLYSLAYQIRALFGLGNYRIPPFFLSPNNRCTLWHSDGCICSTFCSRCDSAVETDREGTGKCSYCGLGFKTVLAMAPTDDGEELMRFIEFDDHPDTDEHILQFVSSIEGILLSRLNDPEGEHAGGVDMEEKEGKICVFL